MLTKLFCTSSKPILIRKVLIAMKASSSFSTFPTLFQNKVTKGQFQFYLLIRFWYQAGNIFVAIQELFKVFIADNKFLCFSQGILTSVLPFNEQTLEYLKTKDT